MSVQDTNLVSEPVFVGLDNFVRVWNDPLFWTAVKQHPLVRAAGAGVRLSHPARAGRAHEHGPPSPGPVQRPRVPAGGGAAGGRGAALEVLLRRQPRRGVQHDPRLVRHRAPAVAPERRAPRCRRWCIEATWANAGATVIIYLAALVAVPVELYDAAEVDGAGLWRKVWHVTVPQLRGVLLVTLILQIIGTAQVFLEPFLFTAGGPANATMTVLLLIYKYAFQNSLGGDYGAATALSLMLGRCSWPVLRGLLPAHPVVGQLMRRAAGVAAIGAVGGARGARASCRTATGSRPAVRHGLRAVHLRDAGVPAHRRPGPLLWLAKSAVTPTQDTLRMPMALWPNGIDIDNLATAWNKVHIDRYFVNTLVIAAGAWLVQIVVATTGGYALSVLRPRYAPVITGLVLATLFVPAMVLLVPLYLTILDPPCSGSQLINSFWAVWLPAGASAFNVILVKRFFDNLPREVFEAARTDGAGTVPAVLVDRAADVTADPGRGLGVRGHRDLEGLPVAAAGAARPDHAAALGPPADHPDDRPSWTCSWRRSPSRRSSPSPSSSSSSAVPRCAAGGRQGWRGSRGSAGSRCQDDDGSLRGHVAAHLAVHDDAQSMAHGQPVGHQRRRQVRRQAAPPPGCRRANHGRRAGSPTPP